MEALKLIKEKADYAAFKARTGMDKVTRSEPKKSDKEWLEKHSNSSYTAGRRSPVKSVPSSHLFKQDGVRELDVSGNETMQKTPPLPKRIGYVVPELRPGSNPRPSSSRSSSAFSMSGIKVPPPKPSLPPRARPIPGTSISTSDLHEIKAKLQETNKEELKSGYKMLNRTVSQNGNSSAKPDDKINLSDLKNSLRLVNRFSGTGEKSLKSTTGNMTPSSSIEERPDPNRADQYTAASQLSASNNHDISRTAPKIFNVSLPKVNRILAPAVEKASGPPQLYKSGLSPRPSSISVQASTGCPTELHEVNLPSEFFPAYNELAATLPHVRFYQIDGAEHEQVKKIYPTSGYPTIYVVGRQGRLRQVHWQPRGGTASPIHHRQRRSSVAGTCFDALAIIERTSPNSSAFKAANLASHEAILHETIDVFPLPAFIS
ncbi:Protein disulfide isomerase-like 2-2 [Neolecta irregularis DAH-3]|uniref:Protein disulfide isomerase-like 2-2 n=1 Tax=Neolecta irregularis (strain DAH-3) TaxID=1198029 RepID=A0A1U7LVB8_NEOID|nr:Protein disulfide isomerase-like 2-2 [Neolecta irregularis DAH-3]|eukprot:OLL26626.1 Protein disulfide isomerase-like 2-2 [Neolecta irregularis DAH-3]